MLSFSSFIWFIFPCQAIQSTTIFNQVGLLFALTNLCILHMQMKRDAKRCSQTAWRTGEWCARFSYCKGHFINSVHTRQTESSDTDSRSILNALSFSFPLFASSTFAIVAFFFFPQHPQTHSSKIFNPLSVCSFTTLSFSSLLTCSFFHSFSRSSSLCNLAVFSTISLPAGCALISPV